jgi:hypothetical protein
MAELILFFGKIIFISIMTWLAGWDVSTAFVCDLGEKRVADLVCVVAIE